MANLGSFEKDYAFTLHECEIRQIWRILEKRIGSVYAEASCIDGIKRSFMELEELLQYPNTQGSAIYTLHFYANSEDDDSSYAKVNFEDSVLSPISLIVKSHEEVIAIARNELSGIFHGTREWFTPLAMADTSLISSVIFFSITSLVYYLAIRFYLIKDAMPYVFAFVLMNLLLAASIIYIYRVLAYLQAYFFPIASFAIGQGETRYRKLKKRRKLLPVFLVSVFASVVATFVPSWLSAIAAFFSGLLSAWLL